MESRRNYRTIVLSDIHLGTSHSKVEQVCNFLSQANCERLILNGDIIDGWSLQKFGAGKWKPQHTRILQNNHEDDGKLRNRSNLYKRES